MDSTPTLATPVPSTVAEAFSLLRAEITGRVHTPGDAGYATARGTAQPRAVVVAAGPDDVARAVRLARAHDLRVAVRSTGNRPGQPAEGAILIDVGALGAVSVDPAGGTATVAAGATWADVLAATLPYGLAPVSGEWSDRAAVSDTLAGGMGWLARRYGLACDSVARFELVTPDGLVVDVTPDSQQELFWALGGAGDGSLGVVTSIELDLHPARALYAGALRYPRAMAASVLERWREWTTAARPELTTSVVVTSDAVSIHGCWAGSIDTGERLIDAWRAWSTPSIDDWCVRPPGVLDRVNPAEFATGAPATGAMTSEWANALRDELLAELLALSTTGALDVFEVRLGGGAARARSGAAANAHGRRDQFLLTLGGLRRPVAEVRTRLARWVTGAVYLDRTDRSQRTARTRDAFGDEQWARLAAVKAALDPHGRFCHGLPIT